MSNQEILLDIYERMCYNEEKNKEVSPVRQNSPVDVISVCSADGTIKPLRLRMEDEDHQLLRIDIEEVISSKEIQYVGIEAHVFLCRATIRGRESVFELKYTIRSHNWCFMRKVY